MKIKRKKFRKLKTEVAWALMIGAICMLAVAFAVPQPQLQTQMLMSAITVFILGAISDLLGDFIIWWRYLD